MQQKILIGLALTLIIVIFIPVYWATESARQETARERQKAEAMERGAELYISNCAVCHGPAGEGKIAPTLKGISLDENVLEKIISRGIAGTAMPAMGEEDGGPLNRHQIKDLITFIRNWDQSLIELPSASSPTSTPSLAPTPAPAPETGPEPATSPAPEQVWTPVTSLDEISYDPNIPASVLLSGKRTFQSSCSACHDLPSSQSIKDFASDEELLGVAIPMTKLAELPMDYSEKVIRYLLAIRYNTAP